MHLGTLRVGYGGASSKQPDGQDSPAGAIDHFHLGTYIPNV